MRVFLFAFLIALQLSVYSQTKKQLLQIANKAYLLQDYYSAINLYQNYLEAYPSEIEVKYKLSKSYIELNDFGKAIPHLLDIYKTDRDKKFQETSFLLANAYKQTANYRYAKRYFRRALIQQRRHKESYEYKKINQEIKSCDFAQTNYKPIKTKELTNLGSSINSTNADFAFKLIDNNTAIFASTDTFGTANGTIAYSKLFWANKINEQWSRGGLVQLPKSYADHNVVNPFYDDENRQLYFSDCDTMLRCMIKKGDIVGQSLTNIITLNNKINLPFTNNTQPTIAITDSAKYLIFSSDRTGGFGGMDIWYSKISESGYEEPINIGENINSPDHEISPFYKNNTLYFSSNWHLGFGGFDIFKSEGNITSHKKPENLLSPINSISNDLYFQEFEEHFYLTTNRTGSLTFKNDNCCNDIYYSPIVADTNNTTVENTYESINNLLPLALYFDNDLPKKNKTDTTTNAIYTDLLNEYMNRKATYISQNLKGLNKNEAMDKEDDLIDFFDFQLINGANQLDEITKFVEKQISNNEQVKLIVRGYSSSLSNSDYNFKLSQRRINSLQNYFNKVIEKTNALEILALPMGDLISTEKSKDNKRDQIFGLDAVYQRKIEIVGLVGGSTNPENQTISPKLVLPNPIINLGKIKSNVVKYSLTIKNTGNTDLQLIKIVGSHLSNAIFPQLIIPNESTTIELQFNFDSELETSKSYVYFITNETDKVKSIEFRYQFE